MPVLLADARHTIRNAGLLVGQRVLHVAGATLFAAGAAAYSGLVLRLRVVTFAEIAELKRVVRG